MSSFKIEKEDEPACGACMEGIAMAMSSAWASVIPKRDQPVVDIDGVFASLQRRLLSEEGREGAVNIGTLLLHIDSSRPITNFYTFSNQFLLGTGGFGKVYRVSHIETGDARAVKVIEKDVVSTDVGKVCAELEILLQLDHPHVLTLHDFFEDNFAVYFVTDVVEGGDFHTISGKSTEEEVQRLFRQLLRAVVYCHARGVVHRDLKAENCLLTVDSPPNVKVIDFGLSAIRKPSDEDNWMFDLLGTPCYLAPEVMLNKPKPKRFNCWPARSAKTKRYGEKCDVWSLGVLLYYMLTGEHPFQADDFLENYSALFDHVLRVDFDTDPLEHVGITPEPRDLISRLLSKDPEKRPSAAEALEDMWLAQTAPYSPRSRASLQTSSKRLLTRERRRSSGQFRKTFGAVTRFEQAVMTLIVRQAHEKELAELREAFMELDSLENGTLSHDEVVSGLRRAGIEMSDDELEAIIRGLDIDGSGQIHYTEWLAATIQPDILASKQALKAAFDFFDAENDGRISEHELVTVLGEDVARIVMQHGDKAGDGFLSQDEFIDFVLELMAHRDIEDRESPQHGKMASTHWPATGNWTRVRDKFSRAPSKQGAIGAILTHTARARLEHRFSVAGQLKDAAVLQMPLWSRTRSF